MSLRHEFVQLAMQDGANVSQLCRRFEISRKTGYKWIKRYKQEGLAGLCDRSRRPRSSPLKTPDHIEEAVCKLRHGNPAWGGRKLRCVLERQAESGQLAFRVDEVPAASTITAILRRRGLLREEDAKKPRRYQRFEKKRPNELWQMDFKGDFLMEDKTRCYPLTVVDDHSRFAVVLAACPNQQRETVQTHLKAAFRRYGLPRRIITDHGAPWGVGMERAGGASFYTRFSAWLMRLGVGVSFTARAHPQTNGKNERFNKTLGAEVLRFERFGGLRPCQRRFDRWRRKYNLQRPHEALEMAVPASRYQVSTRAYPEIPPLIEYGPGDHVRKVNINGKISFNSCRFRVGKAFQGESVAVRPTQDDRKWTVWYCHQHIRTIDFNHNNH